ncbi:HupE/UreJ family protein [Acinetobacter brisouii]|uniref:HupE/UreJ family protein n=1 Tax=Acinetobacter brisouii TaxID=396323 RepID=UPI0005F85AC0|nr:HupE/UreJ family protein [Acinetobacter brisouii]KJV40451.1 urease accessory protein [Acinetobacter brisouii]
MKILKTLSSALILSVLPVLAMAHPGHEFPQLGFLSGFVHPFTGLDHMSMAAGLGVLLWKTKRQWQMSGVIALMAALLIGFVVGAQNLLSASVAEYGIVASLMLLAVALWRKHNVMMPVATAALAIFQGMAHGVELSSHGHWAGLMLGMVTAMALLYGIGLSVGALLERYIPQQGRKIVAGVVALVGLFGLA